MIDVVSGPAPAAGGGDALVVPVFADMTFGPGADWAVSSIGDWAVSYLEGQGFNGEAGQTAILPGGDGNPYGSVIFVGLGAEIDAEGLRRAAGVAGVAASNYVDVTTTLHQLEVDEPAELVTFGFLLGQYRFNKYLSDPKEAKTSQLVLADAGDVEAATTRGRVIAEAVALARDLINEPAVAKPPAVLAERAVAIAVAHDLDIRVYDEADIETEGFGGLRAVAAGSTNPPRLVVMRYTPDAAKRTVAFVGKGIVFDSGGLSLKKAASMETMKADMSGAAAVFAAVEAVARLKLDVNVVGITPLTENLTGGGAQRPGDVLRARNGKTIEVLNTDAEGRLILADGLSLAAEEKPDLIVDIATLTSAMAIALGGRIGAVFTPSDEIADMVVAAAKRAGEKFWRMPLEPAYRALIESDVADMRNSSKERYGSGIAAALLLSEFVADVPWAHLDIAGAERAEKGEHYLAKGAVGFGVRTLIEIASAVAE
jgi:leucyl aminopeptidase